MPIIDTGGEVAPNVTERPPLTPDMQALLALEVSLVLFLIFIASPLPTGETPPYAVAWLTMAVPFLLFLYVGWRGEGWAFLGAAVVSVALIVFVSVNVFGEGGTTPGAFALSEVWGLVTGQILLALIALEGFKAYLQSKGSAA